METIVNFKQAVKLYTYEEYKNTIIKLFEAGLSTGKIQNEERLSATKINLHRIKRLDKTIKIEEKLKDTISNLKKSLTFYLISEGWCGDSAQSAPVISKITELSEKINLKIILRDENPQIMDAYLTNGGKAIPKVICIDEESQEELWTWGPRPTKINEMVQAYKAEFTLDNHDEFVKNLHLWYAKDKGKALQNDFLKLFCN